MTAAEALRFVHDHGAVLVAAKGPVPRLVEAIAGAPLAGSWWAHPQGREIFAILQQLGDSPDILVCRLVNGHVTFVHRRLWPALVRMAANFEPGRLAQIRQEHTRCRASRQSLRRRSRSGYPQEILEEHRMTLSELQALQDVGTADTLAGAAGRLPARRRP